jgi:hypothetical protein
MLEFLLDDAIISGFNNNSKEKEPEETKQHSKTASPVARMEEQEEPKVKIFLLEEMKIEIQKRKSQNRSASPSVVVKREENEQQQQQQQKNYLPPRKPPPPPSVAQTSFDTPKIILQTSSTLATFERRQFLKGIVVAQSNFHQQQQQNERNERMIQRKPIQEFARKYYSRHLKNVEQQEEQEQDEQEEAETESIISTTESSDRFRTRSSIQPNPQLGFSDNVSTRFLPHVSAFIEEMEKQEQQRKHKKKIDDNDDDDDDEVETRSIQSIDKNDEEEDDDDEQKEQVVDFQKVVAEKLRPSWSQVTAYSLTEDLTNSKTNRFSFLVQYNQKRMMM